MTLYVQGSRVFRRSKRYGSKDLKEDMSTGGET